MRGKGIYMSESDNTTPYAASQYDEQIRRTLRHYDLFHEETIRLVEAVNPHPDVWFDTGCGTGTLVEKAADVFRATRFILADPSMGMLEEAGKKLSHYGAARVRILGPAATCGVSLDPEDSPDVITAIQSHHYHSMGWRRKATETSFSLLRPGGIFITFENIRPFTAKGIETALRMWRRFQLESGRKQADVERHIARLDTEYFPVTVEDHLRVYRGCGFGTVELFWYSCMQAGFYCIK